MHRGVSAWVGCEQILAGAVRRKERRRICAGDAVLQRQPSIPVDPEAR
jgi:hypothetical protein